jgi:16S rRNA (uracil1498-N3)-methyltransferase
VVIPSGLAHRLRRVLRLGPGDHIVVLDNTGWEYDVVLQEAGRGGLEGAVTGKSRALGEPRARITLYQALLKGRSLELVLQKCTEVGVTGFVPMMCERCVAGEPTPARMSRWGSIILEAAQQSRRGKLPVLRGVVPFRDACRMAAGVSLLPWEGETGRDIGDVLKAVPRGDACPEIDVFVGPEGGFSPQEAEYARGLGIATVSLGKRILRAETAGLVAATAALYEFGDLGGGEG